MVDNFFFGLHVMAVIAALDIQAALTKSSR
jgi:hypothetical protein